MMRKIGVLTSGGDAPGMNAAVMSIARSAAAYGMPLIGIKHGYNGLLRKSTSIKDDLQELYLDTVLDIADQPGTYLRTVGTAGEAVLTVSAPQTQPVVLRFTIEKEDAVWN